MSLAVSAGAPAAANRWPRHVWLLAVPLAGVWFLLWGLLWQPEEYVPHPNTPHFLPHARYLSMRRDAPGAGEGQQDLRVMWSPVLFALPTPMGFSRTSATGEGRDHPRVQRPSVEPLLLQPAPVAAGAPVVPVPAAPAFNDGVNFRLAGPAPIFAAVPPPTNSLALVWLGGLAQAQALEKTLPALPPALVAEAWSILAHIEVNREGGVQHVFLDPPSASADFNAQLVQALYRWRFAASAAGVQGVVRLQNVAAHSILKSTPETAAP